MTLISISLMIILAGFCAIIFLGLQTAQARDILKRSTTATEPHSDLKGSERSKRATETSHQQTETSYREVSAFLELKYRREARNAERIIEVAMLLQKLEHQPAFSRPMSKYLESPVAQA